VTATRQSWTEKERPLAIGSPHHGYQPPCVGFTTFSAVAVILAHGGGMSSPLRERSKITHAIGFSQWLMMIFPGRRIHSASGRANPKLVRGAECEVQYLVRSDEWGVRLLVKNFSAVRQRCPPKSLANRYSLFANRCRFWLGRSLALPRFSLHPSPVSSGLSSSM
jgi:hypothetical protein